MKSMEKKPKVLKPEKRYEQKFVILTRHGELDVSPESPIYNRDEVMKQENIVYLSDEGKKQMKQLARLIQAKQFRCVKILTSPQKRTLESTKCLNEILKVNNIVTSDELNEVFAPGAYFENYKMKDLPKIQADSDLMERLRKQYKHEKLAHLIKRMQAVFWREAKRLKTGEAVIFVSHGDPISHLTRALLFPKAEIPTGKELREKMYCPKGNALVAVINPEGKLFRLFFLDKVRKDKIY